MENSILDTVLKSHKQEDKETQKLKPLRIPKKQSNYADPI